MEQLSHGDYTNLLRFRSALRRFESWSADQARRAGLTPAQHQLLLAVKGHPDGRGPTIREAAEYLNTRHHSVVGLVDRAELAGLVRRTRDESDGRTARLVLTERGDECIAKLTQLHVAELARLAPMLRHVVANPPTPEQEPSSPAGLVDQHH